MIGLYNYINSDKTRTMEAIVMKINLTRDKNFFVTPVELLLMVTSERIDHGNNTRL